MDKTDIIGQINGQFGKWQLKTVLLIFLCKIPSSWFMACIIYTAPAPRDTEFFCRPPETAISWINESSSWNDVIKFNKTEWINIAHPLKLTEDNIFNIDFCNLYTDAEQYAEQYFHSLNPIHLSGFSQRNSSIMPCDNFVHHANHRTIITDFDLVCSRDILVATTQFFHLFGVLSGGLLAVNLLKL